MLDLTYTLTDGSRHEAPGDVEKVQINFKDKDGGLYRLTVYPNQSGQMKNIDIDLEYPPDGKAMGLESIWYDTEGESSDEA